MKVQETVFDEPMVLMHYKSTRRTFLDYPECFFAELYLVILIE